MNRRLNRLALSVLLLSGSAVAAPTQSISVPPAQQKTLGIEVGAVQAVESVFGRALPAEVSVPPRQLRVVTAPQAGLVEGLEAAVGDSVSRGDIIAYLQSPDIIALQREFLQALTQQRLAHQALTRDRTLLDEGIIAERRYQETESRYHELSATLAERRQALLLAGMHDDGLKKLEQTRQLSPRLGIQAPLDGVVLAVNTEAGRRVSVSDPMFRLAQLEPLWLEVRAPLEQSLGLATDTPVKLPALGISGRVIAVGRDVDPDSQTVLVRAEVTEGAELLRPGQYVEAVIAEGGGAGRFSVPARAVVRAKDATYVFVATTDGFRPQQVEVVGSQEGNTIVRGPLSAGERIAVAGLAALKGAWMGLGGDE